MSPSGCRIHHQRLIVGHLGQILHRKQILRPVLEHGTVTAVGNQLVGMLRHSLVQVVLDHHHNRSGLTRLVGILLDRTGIHLIIGTETIHIDTTVLVQLLGELAGQHFVVLGREVAQGIADGQHALLLGEYLLTLGRVVDGGIVRFRCGQHIGDTRLDLLLKFLYSHCFICIKLFNLALDDFQNLTLGFLRIGDDPVGLADQVIGDGTVFQTGGIDLHVQTRTQHGAAGSQRSDAGVGYRIGISCSAIAFTISNTLNEVCIVRRGTCVA